MQRRIKRNPPSQQVFESSTPPEASASTLKHLDGPGVGVGRSP
jgi:hypothetical protein